MNNPILGNNVITDKALCSWIRCKRKVWLDLNEKNYQKNWSAHRALQLDHQYKSLSAFTQRSPEKGLGACKKGALGIVGLRLKGISPSGQLIEAHPALLHKIDGESRWGPFSYIPVIVRQGHQLTREHRLCVALWGHLLEQLQQKEVTHGLVISKVNKNLEIEKIMITQKIKLELFNALKRVGKEIRKSDLPPLTLDRKKCNICSWKNFCDKTAYQDGDLSEVSGIGGKRKNILQEIGIKNLNQLALTNTDSLINKMSSYGESHKRIASQIIIQANVQKDLSPRRIDKYMVLPELNSSKGVFIYDIESDPDLRLDFLHGFVTIKRGLDGEWSLKDATYEPIFNLTNNNKGKTWERIKKKFTSYPDYPILHYGATESLSICHLAKSQGEEDLFISKIKDNFIDIHTRLKKGWVLPIKSYSLKSVGEWLEFKWSKKGTNGAKALLWWRQYEKSLFSNSKKSNQLKLIREYNKDDCMATWAIAQWIINQN